MVLFDFYKIGEVVIVMLQSERDIHFAEAQIKTIGEKMTLLFSDGHIDDYSVEEVSDVVFKRTPFTDDQLNRFAEGQISKKEVIGVLTSEMLSRQFCDQCRVNHTTPIQISERVFSYGDTSMTIPDFEYMGFVWVGDDEDGDSQDIFKHKGRYYISYLAGNQHEHLGFLSNEAFEKMKSSIIKPKKGSGLHEKYLA